MKSKALEIALNQLTRITASEILELKEWYKERGKQSFRLATIMYAAVLLSGCVAVWGKSYNVAMANSRSVVIEYDRVVANMPAMLNAAQTECNKYGKDAVLDSVAGGNLGIRVNTYRCETRKADTVIDVQG